MGLFKADFGVEPGAWKVAPPPRLERGTCGLTVRRSNQLS